ncbi:MAG TPA: hypothetical protein VJX94_28160 [Stellaceae bacterium]|nr:hypothetical protein [Stellaceae bacterium]
MPLFEILQRPHRLLWYRAAEGAAPAGSARIRHPDRTTRSLPGRLRAADVFASLAQGFGERIERRSRICGCAIAATGGSRNNRLFTSRFACHEKACGGGGRHGIQLEMIVIGAETVERYFAAHAGDRGVRAARSQYDVWLTIARRAR